MQRSTHRSRTRGAALIAGAVLALSACATNDPVAPPGADPAAATPPALFAGLPACEDLPRLEADPALYRDTPVYGNATELTDQVLSWAEQQPGFEQIWLDRERGGWVSVGFHGQDLTALQAALEEMFPGEGVVAVDVPFTQDELLALHDQVTAALYEAGARHLGSSADVHLGTVRLSGVAADPAAEAALAPFAGQPVCLDGLRDGAAPTPIEQTDGGEGWRLLGEARTGEAYRTGVATTDEQLAALWQEAGLPGAAPAVDWETEIAVWFGDAVSGSCPTRLVDVLVTDATLHGDFRFASGETEAVCTSDANPHAYVVAVERAMLPVGPFVVQLGDWEPFPGTPGVRTEVDVDLSAPGSVATAEQIRTDAGTPPAEPLLIEDGRPDLPANGARYVWHPRPECDGVVIGPFGGDLWRLADGEAEWAETDGQEVGIYPVSDDAFVVSSPQMDYVFVRGGTCEG